ncbi:MAG: DUF1963 domain-containing protein [Marinovum sp.]|nr:DUF1963 domain-containing protein [Marinovum sp.]
MWPKSGQGAAQVFLGQIALEDLPDLPGGPVFPRQGVFYFFGPMDTRAEPSVVYVPEPAQPDWPEHTPPNPSETIRYLSWRRTYFAHQVEPPHAMPAHWPKFAVQAAMVEAVPSVPPRDDDDIDYGTWLPVAEAAMADALFAAFGGVDAVGVSRATPAHLPPVWMGVELTASLIVGKADRAGVFLRRDLDPTPPTLADRLRDRLGLSSEEELGKRPKSLAHAERRETQRQAMAEVYASACDLVKEARAHGPLELAPEDITPKLQSLCQRYLDAKATLMPVGTRANLRFDPYAIAIVIEACLRDPVAADYVSPEAIAATLPRHKLGHARRRHIPF